MLNYYKLNNFSLCFHQRASSKMGKCYICLPYTCYFESIDDNCKFWMSVCLVNLCLYDSGKWEKCYTYFLCTCYLVCINDSDELGSLRFVCLPFTCFLVCINDSDDLGSVRFVCLPFTCSFVCINDSDELGSVRFVAYLLLVILCRLTAAEKQTKKWYIFLAFNHYSVFINNYDEWGICYIYLPCSFVSINDSVIWGKCYILFACYIFFFPVNDIAEWVNC